MSRIERLAWVTLGVNLVTILVGAWVRATGSGAGCGASWPTCRGEVVPELAGATAIEFTHRAVSGVALILVAWLAIAVFRGFRPGHPARLGAGLSVVAIAIESLIGAAIVLFQWVADDASAARAVTVPLHLVNTLFLLAVLTLTVFWLRGGGPLRWSGPERAPLVAIAAGMVLVAGTGAVTALADTLFPRPGLLGGEGVSDVEHFLTRLRMLHPVVALAVGGVAAWWAARRASLPGSAGLAARVVVGAVAVSVLAGFANVVWGTPVWLSLLHLAVADVMWIGWVWLAAARLSVQPEPALAE